MGVVYRGFDPGLQREVAIKVLANAAEADPSKRQRFRSEAEALARFRHRGVVNLHAAGEQQGCPYLVMDYVTGESLQEQIERDPLAPEAAVSLLIPLCEALAAAHAAGILHRDLKPENVLLREEDGSPVLIDFGLAKDMSEGAMGPTRSGAILGTPGFWSPEQARGERGKVGPRTDVYGLGAILYAVLTGEAPFRGGSLAEVVIATANRPADPPSASAPGVDAALDRICLRCLAKDPDERFEGPGALAEALLGWQGRSAAPRLAPLALGAALIASLGLVAYGLQVASGPSLSSPGETPATPASSRTSTVDLEEDRTLLKGTWLPLPQAAPLQQAELSAHHAWVREQVARLDSNAPAFIVLGRRLRGVRLGQHDPEEFHALAIGWRRSPERSEAAPIAFHNAARGGSARSLQELALSYLRADEGLVRDPVLGERLMIGLVGSGYGPAPLALAWFYKGRPQGIERARALQLELAAFVFAKHFRDPKSKSPVDELGRTQVLPSLEAAWRTFRARAQRLETRALAPATRRGPPLTLPIEQKKDLCRESVAELLTRSRALQETHERALKLPEPVAEGDEGKTPSLMRKTLRGSPAALWSLGVEYSKHRLPILRQAGRVLLVEALQTGLNRGLGPLGKSHKREGRDTLAAACLSITAAGRPKDQAWLAAGSHQETLSLEQAWELLWQGYEADRQALSLNREPGPIVLDLPQRPRDLLVEAEWDETGFDLLRIRYPALRALQREVGHLQLVRQKEERVRLLSRTYKERGDGLACAGVWAHLSRLGLSSNLNLLSEGLSNRASIVCDPDLSQVLLYASCRGKRAWTHISRISARLGRDDLHMAALVLAGRQGDLNARSRAKTLATFRAGGVPLPAEALETHRAELRALLAKPPASVGAWSLRRGAALVEEDQRKRVRRIARMVLARDGLLAQLWLRHVDRPQRTLFEAGVAAEAREGGKGASLFLRCATELGDPRVLHPLAVSLGRTKHPARIRLGWALLYSRFDVENTGRAFLDVAQAAQNSNNPRLARALARIAQTDPLLEASSRLERISGSEPLPSLEEAIQIAAEDRERAFLAAGFPCVGWTPRPRVQPR